MSEEKARNLRDRIKTFIMTERNEAEEENV